MAKTKIVRKFDEVVELVQRREYGYVWRPEYVDDLADGPRCCACKGVPQSEGADFIMKGYDITMDREKCVKCGACWAYCPLAVIRETDDGYFEIDPEYCRPCGICAQECPTGAIQCTPI
ncbi:MAG: 4Fe-4S binding protein [Deltaproteobacteria bacterium]|nr:4Fe-4S binding protein [Deltaproteobacteria bacterium]